MQRDRQNKLIIARMKGEEGRRAEACVTALYRRGRPVQLHISGREDGPFEVGDILLGRVEKLQKGLAAAFVRISREETAYLPIRPGMVCLSRQGVLDRPLKAGDEILVEVEKEALKQKKIRLTTEFQLRGRHFVLSLDSSRIRVSKKATEQEARRLTDRMEETLAGFGGRVPFSILARSSALEAEAEALDGDLEGLIAVWRRMTEEGLHHALYARLHRGEEIWEQVVKHETDLGEIVTDLPDLLPDLEDICSPDMVLRLYQDPSPSLFQLYSLGALIERSLGRRMDLRSGGSLILEHTEAFEVIDVNSGRFQGKRTPEATIRLINREAAEAAASAIRLRNLTGTILIDFINEQEAGAAEELLALMRELVREDPVRTRVIDMTPLFIMEITRQKGLVSLEDQWRRLTNGRS